MQDWAWCHLGRSHLQYLKQQEKLDSHCLLRGGKSELTAVAASKPNLFNVRLTPRFLTIWSICGIRNFLGWAAPVVLLELDAMLVKGNSMPKCAHHIIGAGEGKLDGTAVADRVHSVPATVDQQVTRKCVIS